MPREAPVLEATEDPGLAPLLAPLTSLPGIGPVIAKRLIEAIGGSLLRDLLFHLPERYATRIRISSPAEAPPDAEVILPALVGPMRVARSKTGRPYVEFRAEAAGKRLLIRYINGRAEWLRQLLPEATERLFAGRVQGESGAYSMLNPLSASTPEGLPELEPVWPLVKGLTLRHVARAMREALALLPELPEWHDPALLRREGWPGFAEALRQAQAPETPPPPTARTRLAYDEALAGQVALALVRRRVRLRPGRALKGDGTLRAQALAAFGHPLTPSQAHALAEIDADLAAPHRMLRLLQGDVGAGKTLVAVLAMLRAVESGAQAAIMAPTEILARQHIRTLDRLCTPAGIRVELLAGSVKGAQRKRVLAGLAEGSVKIVVGTHALFQEGVVFRDLGLAVVDEQHRFGVAQRLMLAETRFAELSARFPGMVGLAHGKLDTDVREQALRDFAAGRTKLLVATTVIEVGVDVPEATVMVVEHADRFGLAQLHQLRGRVGRGSAASYCMLLYDEGLGLGSRERLMTLRDTEDGFAIADTDFRLRGGGEALGTRQSGAPVFRLGLPETEAQEGLILMANRDAALLLEKDQLLAGPRGAAVRQLLHLFGKDAAMASLGAG